MNNIWHLLQKIYGKTLVDELGEDMPDIWRNTLAEMTSAQTARGISRCARATDARAPTLGIFVNRCLGNYHDHGMLEPDEAFERAASGDLGPVGIYHAVKAIGRFRFQRMNARDAAKLFHARYAEALSIMQKGGRLDMAPTAVPAAKRITELLPHPGEYSKWLELGASRGIIAEKSETGDDFVRRVRAAVVETTK